MVDHLEVCFVHVQCLRSEQCACAEYAFAKQKLLLDSDAHKNCQVRIKTKEALS